MHGPGQEGSVRQINQEGNLKDYNFNCIISFLSDSTDFTRQSVFTRLEEHDWIREKSCAKTFVAPEGVESHQPLLA